ncbi:glycosyltransferase family 2 protein [Halorubrum ezzemoulense]|uniref:glycosyltransferase family 2 protein n=1 Tax=Halorubrum ezzemoulense TaxID=337243 RepID=UPI00232E7523|nr:glycosyltransferase family A protein [Halorubrum ezzemoulense]MDB2239560.1 glycosyltransferase family A protein [Halorubrum ezzemoulense]
MPSPLVSAIIPAYGRPERTQRAIDSVAKQNYTPIELIVVDDGSQPPLRDELSVLNESFRDVVFKRHEENQGGNVARNTGINHASGEYLAFLDSDDEWDPRKVRRQVKRLKRSNFEASYTGVKQLDPEGNTNTVKKATRSGNLLSDLLNGNLIGTFSSVVIESEAVSRVGKPNPDMPSWQDWEWYLRLVANGIRFDAVRLPLTIRHNEGGQVSGTYVPKRNKSYNMIKKRISEYALTADEEQIALAYLDFHLGYSALVNQRYADARKLFLNAIRQHRGETQFFMYLACSGPHYTLMRRIKRAIVRHI